VLSDAASLFHRVIKYPLMTEKALTELELKGKLTFIVDLNANKKMIKDAVEKYFRVKVVKVNTLITPEGLKKAIVTFKNVDEARKVAISLGIL